MFNFKKVITVFYLVLFLFASRLMAEELQPASDFTLKNLKGAEVKLSNIIGKKPIMLFFWNTRCPYCVKQIKVLNDSKKDIQGKGFEILGINTGESTARINSFMQNNKIDLPQILIDEDYLVSEAYGIMGIPTYILVDKKGIIQFENHYYPTEEVIEKIVQEK